MYHKDDFTLLNSTILASCPC